MAGQGERFRSAGYSVPKYMVEVRGRTLFRWAMDSLTSYLRAGADVVFVARGGEATETFVTRECLQLGLASYRLVMLEQPTDGQATSALMGGDALASLDAPFLIYNIDTHVDPAHLPADALHGDGWVPCFPGAGEGWSFFRVDDKDRVLEVQEKRRISQHASIGLYGFSSFALYEDAYRKYYDIDSREEVGERYVAPLYNQLVAEELPVYIHRLPASAVHPLGTPREVEAFGGAE